MIKQEVKIINRLGLHARASSKFTQVASHFKSDVWVTRQHKRVNGKSIMGLMMLAAVQGSMLELEIDGVDESQAITALIDLVNDCFGEEE